MVSSRPFAITIAELLYVFGLTAILLSLVVNVNVYATSRTACHWMALSTAGEHLIESNRFSFTVTAVSQCCEDFHFGAQPRAIMVDDQHDLVVFSTVGCRDEITIVSLHKNTGSNIRRIPFVDAKLFCFAAERLYCSSSTGNVSLFSIHDWRDLSSFRSALSAVHEMRVSANGDTVALCGTSANKNGNAIEVWKNCNAATGPTLVGTYRDKRIDCMALSADGTKLAFSGYSGNIVLVHVGASTKTLVCCAEPPCNALLFSSDGQRIFVFASSSIRVCDSIEHVPPKVIPTNAKGPIIDARISRRLNALVCLARYGDIYRLEGEVGSHLERISGDYARRRFHYIVLNVFLFLWLGGPVAVSRFIDKGKLFLDDRVVHILAGPVFYLAMNCAVILNMGKTECNPVMGMALLASCSILFLMIATMLFVTRAKETRFIFCFIALMILSVTVVMDLHYLHVAMYQL